MDLGVVPDSGGAGRTIRSPATEVGISCDGTAFLAFMYASHSLGSYDGVVSHHLLLCFLSSGSGCPS